MGLAVLVSHRADGLYNRHDQMGMKQKRKQNWQDRGYCPSCDRYYFGIHHCPIEKDRYYKHHSKEYVAPKIQTAKQVS
jgi:hypothetical protein